MYFPEDTVLLAAQRASLKQNASPSSMSESNFGVVGCVKP